MQATRVLSWNLRGARGIASDRLERCASLIVGARADIVAVQELPAGQGARLLELLQSRDPAFVGVTAAEMREGSKHGVAVLAKAPVVQIVDTWAGARTRFCELRLHVRFQYVDGRRLDVIVVHIPNGSAHGWRKVDAMADVLRGLERTRGVPRVVAGDFNEPKRMLPGGQLVAFGDQRVVGGRVVEDESTFRCSPGPRNKDCGPRPRSEWQGAVARLLRWNQDTDLHHALLDESDVDELPCTYETPRPRYFDHILVSSELDVVKTGFHHEWRQSPDPASDHSGAWADVKLRE